MAKGVKIEHAHQQARLAAGTVADNDEFPTELGHRGWTNWQALMQGQISEGCCDGGRGIMGLCWGRSCGGGCELLRPLRGASFGAVLFGSSGGLPNQRTH